MSHPSKWRRPCCDIYPEPDSLAASLRKVRFAIRPILTWNSATSRPFASMHRIARLWRRGFCALGTYLVRGWSLTHRKSTSRDGLFAHENIGRKTSPYRASLLYHKHRNVHGVRVPYALEGD